jgi:hypothetical protein
LINGEARDLSKHPPGEPMTLGNMRAKSFIVLLAFTPLNLPFDRFSQHMRAILKSLQHVIDAGECSALHPHKEAF